MNKLLTLFLIGILNTMVFGQHYTFDKINQDGGTGSDYTYDITVDDSGNKYITGKYNAEIDFGSGVIISPVHNYDIYVAKYDKDNNIQWANSFGGNSADEGRTVVVDKDGNVIVTASFFGSVSFGADTLFGQGNFDIVVVKFDSEGNYLWMKHAYTNSQDKTSDMKIDSEGNYVVTGYYGGNAVDTLRYEGLEVESHGEREVFVIKMDSDGNPIWGVTGGGADNDYSGELVIDKNDNIYFNGYYDKVEATFGSTVLPNDGDYDMFIAKLNSSGEYQWAVSANGPGDDKGYGIDYVDKGETEPGVVITTGSFQDSLYVGPNNELHESAGGYDIFVLSYTDAGVYDGMFSFGSDDDDEGKKINSIPGNGGGYYVSGTTRSNIVTADNTLENYGARDMIVLRMYQDSLVWVKNYGGSSDDYINAAYINDEGLIYFAGNCKSTPAQFDPFTIESSKGHDLWMGELQDHSVVYFECNLAVQIANGTFDPTKDEVFLRGDFQADAKDPNGNWQGKMFQLFDEDQNQVYSVMVNLPSDTGNVYEYLYVINDEMESINPRNFNLLVPDTWVSQAFFNSDAIPSRPLIFSISDIPNDQGGSVRISFSTSKSNSSYSIWRKMDNNGWDAIGSFDAIQDSVYNYVSPTLGDSTVNGIHWSVFRVSAHTSNPSVFYMSEPDSGYSIDNLAPLVPASVIASGYDDMVELAWDESVEKDFQYYAIYRSLDSEFSPDTMNTYTYSTTEKSFTDVDVIKGNTYYYYIAAVDYSGNYSEFSEIVYALITDVKIDGEIPTVYELGQNYPNPFNPSTLIKYSLPESGLVTLKVFNILGQEVIQLVNEVKQVGVYEVSFDASSLTTGMYIYTIQSGKFSETKKMMLIK